MIKIHATINLKALDCKEELKNGENNTDKSGKKITIHEK